MASQHPKNRVTDGLTVNKVMVIITGSTLSLAIAIVGWVYTTDRATNLKYMETITEKVSQMATNQIIDRSQLLNMDARIISNKESISSWRKESKEDMRLWKSEVRNYWNKIKL